MAMADESPSYPRVVLGEEIKRLREESGLNQTELAQRIGSWQSRIASLEKARIKTIKVEFLDAILEVLRVDPARAVELRGFARTPYGERGVWNAQTWWRGKLRAEQLAFQITSVQLEALDGLIHCEGYMRRQFQLEGRIGVSDAVKTRKERQEVMFGRSPAPKMTFICAQGSLRRSMGDPAMMITQLEHLLELSRRPQVEVLIVPDDAHLPTRTYSFSVLRFASKVMTDIAIVENLHGATVIDEVDLADDYLRRAQFIREHGCLNQFDSRRCIEREIAAHHSALRGK